MKVYLIQVYDIDDSYTHAVYQNKLTADRELDRLRKNEESNILCTFYSVEEFEVL